MGAHWRSCHRHAPGNGTPPQPHTMVRNGRVPERKQSAVVYLLAVRNITLVFAKHINKSVLSKTT
jgi:hypothetical protein